MSESPFPETSFAYLYEREDQHWWFRARNDVILWAIKRFIGRFGVLLEDGCGNGYVLAAIKHEYPDATYHGNEYFEDALRFARMRLPDVTFTREDITKMNSSAQYDVIGMFDVLEHIDDDVAAVQKCHQALHPNGHLIISVPQHK
ncbi:MAG: class I SAM-dependent methyltransferase [Chloroflexi bacterium]|nr:class I SAM-dependent methyltransferase [Chloroflexota bacterium]